MSKLAAIFHWKNLFSVSTLAGVAVALPSWENFYTGHDYKDLIQAVAIFVWGLVTNASSNSTVTPK